jgi:sec-independent protein translocase protein TatA
MLGLDNPLHIAFILVLLLLVFGAKRLPEMGRSLGEGLRGFKQSISGEGPTTQLTEAPAHPSVRVDATPATHTHAAADEPIAEHTPLQPVA